MHRRTNHLWYIAFLVLPVVAAYQQPQQASRRAWITQQVGTLAAGLLVSPPPSHANDLVDSIYDAQTTLGNLLTNWKRATVQCNYADVPRDLLSAENKQELLEKASTYALFDKSVSVESCKTSNRLVRDYIGVTGKGPMVGIEKKIRQALDLVDPDLLDDYVSGTSNHPQRITSCKLYG